MENSFSDASLSCCAENSAWIVTWNNLMYCFKITLCYPKWWCFTCPDSLCKPECKCKASWRIRNVGDLGGVQGTMKALRPTQGLGQGGSGVTPLLCGWPCSAASFALQTKHWNADFSVWNYWDISPVFFLCWAQISWVWYTRGEDLVTKLEPCLHRAILHT